MPPRSAAAAPAAAAAKSKSKSKGRASPKSKKAAALAKQRKEKRAQKTDLLRRANAGLEAGRRHAEEEDRVAAEVHAAGGVVLDRAPPDERYVLGPILAMGRAMLGPDQIEEFDREAERLARSQQVASGDLQWDAEQQCYRVRVVKKH